MTTSDPTGATGGAGGVLATAGVEELRRTPPLVSEQAVDGLRADSRSGTGGRGAAQAGP